MQPTPLYLYAEVRQLHIEITTACNASCPLCPRNVSGGRVNPRLPLAELTLADIAGILPVEFIRQLDLVFLCGNYGDPMVGRDTLPVLEHLRRTNPRLRLGIHTNGSGRQPDWWQRLACTIDYCRFGIDGLADTNHLYRRGTRWEKVIESATAFIAAGGRAEWDFIVFRHNEHQVEEARELSRRLGFAAFYAKKSYRFVDPRSGRRTPQIPVVDRQDRFEYLIAEPSDDAFHNQSLVRFGRLVDDSDSYRTYLDSTPISCKAAANRSLYLSAEGLIFPCCWTADLYSRDGSLAAPGISRLLEQLPEGKRALDARAHPVREIVAGPLFEKLLPVSWVRPRLATGKVEVCAQMCGAFDLYSAQVPARRDAAASRAAALPAAGG